MLFTASLQFPLGNNPHYLKSYIASSCVDGYIYPNKLQFLEDNTSCKVRANVKNLLEPTKISWKSKGVSVVSDGWSDSQRKPINQFHYG